MAVLRATVRGMLAAEIEIEIPVAAIDYVVLEVASAELDTRGLVRLVQDAVLIEEVVSIALAKQLADAIAMSDSFALSLQRALADAVAISDAARIDMNKSLADAVAATDSGAIYRQDYFAQDYTEPGYTGDIYAF